jgi:RimJ/RimL family protein N-acetyltransferase
MHTLSKTARPTVELQPFAREDFDRLIFWIDSLGTLRDWAGIFFSYPLTVSQLEPYLHEAEQGRIRVFHVVDQDSKQVIGHIELSHIIPGLTGFISRVLIGERSFRGKGFGEEMVREAIRFAFQEYGFHRLDLGVLRTNLGAIRCYERIGFQHVGMWENGFKTPEGPLTVRWMTLFRADWELAEKR